MSKSANRIDAFGDKTYKDQRKFLARRNLADYTYHDRPMTANECQEIERTLRNLDLRFSLDFDGSTCSITLGGRGGGRGEEAREEEETVGWDSRQVQSHAVADIPYQAITRAKAESL